MKCSVRDIGISHHLRPGLLELFVEDKVQPRVWGITECCGREALEEGSWTAGSQQGYECRGEGPIFGVPI